MGGSSEWETALEERILGKDPVAQVEEARPLRVLPLDNTQAHALTCSKAGGSSGHHFRVLGDGVDALVCVRVLLTSSTFGLMHAGLAASLLNC